MKIKTAEIQAVTGRRDQYPPDDMKEIAFAGRSNVGKSSLLNLLTGRKKLAKVSGSPGKTRTINFYLINNAFRIVDLPGYGYAKVAKSMSEDWGRMMDEYFQHRDGLVKVVQLVDIRHDPSKQDVQMYEYLKHYGLDGLVVATKSDKISRNEMQKNMARIRKVLGMGKDDILIPVSALKKTGHEQLLDAMEAVLTASEGAAAEEVTAEEQGSL
jgi:GTP-binding protein